MQPAYLTPHTAGDAQYCTMHHPPRQGRSTVTVRFQHLIAQQRSHRVIHSTNHGILTVRASANTQDATTVILQNILSTMQGILTADMAVLLQTSEIIHIQLSLTKVVIIFSTSARVYTTLLPLETNVTPSAAILTILPYLVSSFNPRIFIFLSLQDRQNGYWVTTASPSIDILAYNL